MEKVGIAKKIVALGLVVSAVVATATVLGLKVIVHDKEEKNNE